MWDSGFYMCPPLGFSLFPYFLLCNSCFTFSLSLFIFLGLWIMHRWALGHKDMQKCSYLRRWLTIRKFDMKQMKLVLKKSKDDSARWENRITIKMKQNDKYDTPKSVAEMFSNFRKQIHGYAGEVQARNKGKTCKSSANKTIKFTRNKGKHQEIQPNVGHQNRFDKNMGSIVQGGFACWILLFCLFVHFLCFVCNSLSFWLVAFCKSSLLHMRWAWIYG